MTWIFLHGLGQAPSAWQPVLRRLEPELTVHCPSLSELAAGDPRYPALLSALETAVTEGRLTEQRIDESALRVLMLKLSHGIAE